MPKINNEPPTSSQRTSASLNNPLAAFTNLATQVVNAISPPIQPQPQAAPIDNAEMSMPNPMLPPREDAVPPPYQTVLPAPQEEAFQKWTTENQIPFNAQDRSGKQDYDMRGFWQAKQKGDPNAVQAASNKHFPDTWKTPYHKTFSQESKYAVPGKAPQWQENILMSRDGKIVADETPKSK